MFTSYYYGQFHCPLLISSGINQTSKSELHEGTCFSVYHTCTFYVYNFTCLFAGSAWEQHFVRQVIELHDKYMLYVGGCFANSSLFHKALKEAFEFFCNKNVAGSSTAELMANFCDNLLRKVRMFLVFLLDCSRSSTAQSSVYAHCLCTLNVVPSAKVIDFLHQGLSPHWHTQTAFAFALLTTSCVFALLFSDTAVLVVGFKQQLASAVAVLTCCRVEERS